MDGAMELFETNGVRIDLAHPRIQPVADEFRRGAFEASEAKITRRVVRPHHRILELGTCTGFIAMIAARIVGPANIRSYEANPENAALAAHHFAANGLPVELYNTVLLSRRSAATHPATVPFFVSPSLVSSSLIPIPRRGTVDVPVAVFEEEVARHGANFLIMDIEGGEVDLLGTADLDPITGIILETHYRKAGVAPTDAMMKRLYDRGFRINLRSSGSETLHLYREGHEADLQGAF
ncbi:FkbM family methyltransferase [Roseomonas populi]|uniref:FkbM family methyltransferase n=1 Tax=Roseomonas populi TaxID=3121582 RepID=A0ABT1WXE0_9PROT|nr:FkbM family methyltransferase [Roseomonas pecuniae]MCR0980505.1 FkbM family methyltransferase [Roseomonas pecuniae]